MKYRSLSTEELVTLEKEFINFLITNSIAAEDWEKLKKEDSEAVTNLIELFSDMVFEKIMLNVKFLEYRSTKEVRSFQCLSDSIVEVGIKLNKDAEIDFSDPSFLQNPHGKLYIAEKKYTREREVELFAMIQAGFTISDGKLFKALCLALPK